VIVNSLLMPGRVPFDWILKSLEFWGIHTSGLPMRYFMDRKSMLGGSLTNALGKIRFPKMLSNKNSSVCSCFRVWGCQPG